MKISDVSRFKSWHSKRMGHPIGVILGIDAVSELESEVERLELNHGRVVEEIAELKEFVGMVANGTNEDPQGAVIHLRIHSREAKNLLAKLNQEGEA